MKRFVVLAPFILSACTTLAPGAAEVKLTHHALDVQNCKVIGPVSTTVSPGFWIGVDDLSKDLRNQAVGLGANCVLITNNLPMAGIAYRCGS
jgi:hypothetical protein